jgi:hypothetical protein
MYSKTSQLVEAISLSRKFISTSKALLKDLKSARVSRAIASLGGRLQQLSLAKIAFNKLMMATEVYSLGFPS